VRGPFDETQSLRTSPYIRGLLAGLGCTVGRTRLMWLEPGAEVSGHVDVHPYWRSHVRLHIPVVSEPGVDVYCGFSKAHMAPGEVWALDTFLEHKVVHGGNAPRIHLVCDVVGSAAVWRLLEGGESPLETWWTAAPHAAALPIEQMVNDADLHPAQLRERLAPVVERTQGGGPGELGQLLVDFAHDWGDSLAAEPGSTRGRQVRARLAGQLEFRLAEHTGQPRLANGMDAVAYIREGILPHLFAEPPQELELPVFESPVFVLSPPRSGSSMLFEALCRSPDVWSIGGESHALVEAIPGLAPAETGWRSNALGAIAVTDAVRRAALVGLSLRLRDHRGCSPGAVAPTLRLVEKTPKNVLRIPFLATLFADARFVLLVRRPRDVLSSMLDGWRSGRFVTYPDLPEWTGPGWSFLLTAGWRELDGAPLHEIVSRQWAAAVEAMLDGLTNVAPERCQVVAYAELVEEPDSTLARLLDRLGLRPPPGGFSAGLPLSRHTLTPPRPEKWIRNEAELAAMAPYIADIAIRLEAFQRDLGSARR